ncbi:MAG: hypothetical protein QXX12_05015 [Nanopusillaceae archaeon]
MTETALHIESVIEEMKSLGEYLKCDFIIVFKNHRIEYHHGHRAMVIETREAETIELEERD